MAFTDEQLERYSRHIILKEVGAKGQKKLLNAKVLIIGAGGLGAPAAMYLAAAGVGTIGIADADEVDLSNLQRQIIHTTQDVGKAKVLSAKETMEAINTIRDVTNNQCFVSGMSAMVTDLKNLCEQEEPIYVAIAVVLAVVVMMLFMDSFLIPIIFLVSIGMAILYNLGSNYFLGEISYITKALSAILQLGVTMDYSICLLYTSPSPRD